MEWGASVRKWRRQRWSLACCAEERSRACRTQRRQSNWHVDYGQNRCPREKCAAGLRHPHARAIGPARRDQLRKQVRRVVLASLQPRSNHLDPISAPPPHSSKLASQFLNLPVSVKLQGGRGTVEGVIAGLDGVNGKITLTGGT